MAALGLLGFGARFRHAPPASYSGPGLGAVAVQRHPATGSAGPGAAGEFPQHLATDPGSRCGSIRWPPRPIPPLLLRIVPCCCGPPIRTPSARCGLWPRIRHLPIRPNCPIPSRTPACRHAYHHRLSPVSTACDGPLPRAFHPSARADGRGEMPWRGCPPPLTINPASKWSGEGSPLGEPSAGGRR